MTTMSRKRNLQHCQPVSSEHDRFIVPVCKRQKSDTPQLPLIASKANQLAVRLSTPDRSESFCQPASSSCRRVRFAAHLVEEIEVSPLVSDEEDKQRLFYEDKDFARFSFNERVRREAVMLTLMICREQTKRMKRGAQAIPSNLVLMSYHHVLCQTEEIPRMVARRTVYPKIVKSCTLQSFQSQEEAETPVNNATYRLARKFSSHTVTARCA